MIWERVLAILAGWTVLPALAWTLVNEILRFMRQVVLTIQYLELAGAVLSLGASI